MFILFECTFILSKWMSAQHLLFNRLIAFFPTLVCLTLDLQGASNVNSLAFTIFWFNLPYTNKMLTGSAVDLFYIEEYRWRGVSARWLVVRIQCISSFSWWHWRSIGILLKEKWVKHVVDVNWVNEKITVIKVLAGWTVIPVVCLCMHLSAG